MTRIEVICRRCGRKAPADEFKVDHVYQLAVCRVCYTERKKDLPKKKEEMTLSQLAQNKMQETKSKSENTGYEIKKSKLLDDDDEYLERAVQRKKDKLKEQRENMVRVRLLKDNKVLYPCQKCDFKFKYNLETKRPVKCPYCEAKVNHNIEF